jgi:hypothetical protein
MIDKTTAGITAEPAEVEAVLNNLCGYHLSEPDAVLRYTALTREQVLYDALLAAIKRERGRALAELVAGGRTLSEVADLTNLGNRQRVQRLIAGAKAAETAAAQMLAASREFDERMAAVEATLDEVVSNMRPPIPTARPPLDDAIEPPSTVDTAPTPSALAVLEPRELTPYEPAARPPAQHVPAHRAPAHQAPAHQAPAYRAPAPDLAPPGPALVWPGEVDQWEDPDDGGRAAMLEPTQVLPPVTAALNPPREADDETPWWRRNRDTGAA